MKMPQMQSCFLVCLSIAALAGEAGGEIGAGTLTAGEKINYALGVEIARNQMNRGITIHPEAFTKGVTDVAHGQKLLLSEKEIRSIIVSVQSDVRRQQSAEKLKQIMQGQPRMHLYSTTSSRK